MAKSKEPKEWQEGELKARHARAVVAGQVAAAILERDATGSQDSFALRLTQLAAAKRAGEPEAIRAAVMEVTLAGAAWVVDLDLRGSG